MSSDSEDDMYTNSAKLLKNLKMKVDKTVFNDVKIDVDDEVTIIEPIDNPSTISKTKRKRKKTKKCPQVTYDEDIIVLDDIKCSQSNPTEVIEINDSIIDTSVAEISTRDTQTADTSLLDSAVESESYTNIIHKLDSYLNETTPKRGRRSTRSTKNTRNIEAKKVFVEKCLSPSKKRITRSTAKQARTERICNKPIIIDPDVPIINTCSMIPDEINDEIVIKILWKSEKKVNFTIRRYQPFKSLFEYFSKEENVPEERLLFMLNDEVITMKDTPHSLNINITSVIEGGVLSQKTHLTSGLNYSRDSIDLKVLIKDRRQPLNVNIKTTDEMSVLMFKCSEELKVSVERLIFKFDGEIVLPDHTVVGLELEGGECIDCIIKSE